MGEENNKKPMFIIILSISIIVLIIISIILTKQKKAENTILAENTIIQPENNINPNLVTDLTELSEMQQYDRIKYYMDKYLFYIEEQKYELAYNMLHEDFKKAHYPTLEQFTQYVIQKYPIVNSIEYTEYVKLGKYHVLTMKFSDILNATSSNIPNFEQKYIIVENNLNDVSISFQAE